MAIEKKKKGMNLDGNKKKSGLKKETFFLKFLSNMF